jgi:hypothetical protein
MRRFTRRSLSLGAFVAVAVTVAAAGMAAAADAIGEASSASSAGQPTPALRSGPWPGEVPDDPGNTAVQKTPTTVAMPVDPPPALLAEPVAAPVGVPLSPPGPPMMPCCGPGPFGPTLADSGLLTIALPAQSKVWINPDPNQPDSGRTGSGGSKRQYVAFGLRPGLNYHYHVVAEVPCVVEFRLESRTELRRLTFTRDVNLRAGGRAYLAFSDRVFIDPDPENAGRLKVVIADLAARRWDDKVSAAANEPPAQGDKIDLPDWDQFLQKTRPGG